MLTFASYLQVRVWSQATARGAHQTSALLRNPPANTVDIVEHWDDDQKSSDVIIFYRMSTNGSRYNQL